MPKVDLQTIEQTNRTGYPAPHHEAVAGRFYRRIGDFGGFVDFDVSHVVLKPGAASSQRHWYRNEDEMVVGRENAGQCHYPDVDMHLDGLTKEYRRKDGGAF